jgi:cell division protein FtsL
MTARVARRPHPLELELARGRAVPAPHPAVKPWIVFAVAVVLAFFGLIYSRISLDNSAFELDELADRISEQEALHWDLRLEVARLQEPQRVAKLAKGMGLVYPAERLSLEVPGVDREGLDPEYRWAQLKALLSAQP